MSVEGVRYHLYCLTFRRTQNEKPATPSYFHQWYANAQSTFFRHQSYSRYNRELRGLIDRLTSSNAHAMEFSTNKQSHIRGNDKTDTFTNGVRLEEVNSLKYSGATLSKDSKSMADIPFKVIAMAMTSFINPSGQLCSGSVLR